MLESFELAKDAVLMGLAGSLVGIIGWLAKMFIESRREAMQEAKAVSEAFMEEIKAVRLSIEKLNLNVAVILSNVSNHEVRLTRLEEVKPGRVKRS